MIIPLRQEVLDILQKCNFEEIKDPCIQTMNKWIKEIVRLAGVNQIVVRTSTNFGEFIDVAYKKYELITTHTARRSFATNAYLAGVPVKKIVIITGHTTEEALFRYIGANELDNAISLFNHPYFSLKVSPV